MMVCFTDAYMRLSASKLRLMYDASIISYFQYYITPWRNSYYRLLKLQKRAIRIVTLSKYNIYRHSLFELIKPLRIQDIFEMQYLKLHYKYRNVILPKYILCFFFLNRHVPNHNSRRTSHLHHVETRTVSAINCFQIKTRRSENDNTPQPLDQGTNSPFIGQQVGNCRVHIDPLLGWSICHAPWPKVNPIVHPTSYPTHIPFIPCESTLPFLNYSNFNI